MQADVQPTTLDAIVLPATSTNGIAESDWVALVLAVSRRDQAALQALYDGAHRLVYTLSFRMTGSRETAEEVTLDVFHEVWRRAPAYEAAGGTVVGWIMNIARSRSIDRLRFEQRKKRAGSAAVVASANDEREPHQRLHDVERGQALRQALTELSAAERQAIEVAYFSGLSYAETAQRLGQPQGTVKTRIRSGLEKLRRLLPGLEERA